MKPFNLEEAKAGKAVCDYEGRPVRIICWDRKHHVNGGNMPIIGLLTADSTRETVLISDVAGRNSSGGRHLFMATVKKKETRYVNVYENDGPGNYMYPTKKEAHLIGSNMKDYITTVPVVVEWEE